VDLIIQAIFGILEKVGLSWWRAHKEDVKEQEIGNVQESLDSASDADVHKRLLSKYERK